MANGSRSRSPARSGGLGGLAPGLDEELLVEELAAVLGGGSEQAVAMMASALGLALECATMVSFTDWSDRCTALVPRRSRIGFVPAVEPTVTADPEATDALRVSVTALAFIETLLTVCAVPPAVTVAEGEVARATARPASKPAPGDAPEKPRIHVDDDGPRTLRSVSPGPRAGVGFVAGVGDDFPAAPGVAHRDQAPSAASWSGSTQTVVALAGP